MPYTRVVGSCKRLPRFQKAWEARQCMTLSKSTVETIKNSRSQECGTLTRATRNEQSSPREGPRKLKSPAMPTSQLPEVLRGSLTFYLLAFAAVCQCKPLTLHSRHAGSGTLKSSNLTTMPFCLRVHSEGAAFSIGKAVL